jgi:hypothetical protein
VKYSSVVLASIFFITIVLAGCVSVTPAPGSDKVRVTNQPADVGACTAVGNIRVPPPSTMDPDQMAEFRNQVVGLGGNAALVTVGGPTLVGIAYRCP